MTEDLFIFDAHCDTAHVLFDHPYDFRDNPSHLDLTKAREGGLKAQIFAVWVDAVYAPHRAIKRALHLVRALEDKVFSPGHGAKVTSVPEMDTALKSGNLACWLFLEGGHIIENSLHILEFFHSIGFRGMTLTHSRNTDWADSSGDTPRWHGLNDMGKQVVKKMEELGMVVDVSHASDETVEDVLEVTSKPVMASHSNARALCDIQRNLPDELIRQIARRNGFIGVNFYPAFLKRSIYDQIVARLDQSAKELQEIASANEHDPDTVSRLSWEHYWKAARSADPVHLSSVIDHIEYIASVGGAGCVGLGSDFDGIPTTPGDLGSTACYPALIACLEDRGFSETDIRGIMGENLLRFLTLSAKDSVV